MVSWLVLFCFSRHHKSISSTLKHFTLNTFGKSNGTFKARVHPERRSKVSVLLDDYSS